MKKWFIECPFCKNDIKEGAVKCQYCWEFLDEKAKPKQEFSQELKYKSFWVKPTIYCPNCWYEGKAKLTAKWSLWVEIVLWLFLLVPWLIYSTWRWSNRYYVCPKCWCEKLVKK